MYVTAIVVMVFLLIYFGVWLCKKNFEVGIDKIMRFRLRYTFILLFVLCYSAYVDSLPDAQKEIKVVQVKGFLSTACSYFEVIAKDSYEWVLAAGENIID
jgi:hypothetical protein